jgi:hypothetical protein
LDGHTFNQSEMALFFECMLLCAQKLLDTADIVREAMFRQLAYSHGDVWRKNGYLLRRPSQAESCIGEGEANLKARK